MVEFAIVGSLLLTLLFAIASVGLFISANMQAADQARQQARTAALDPAICTPAAVAAGTVITRSVTPSFTWIVPLIPAPAANPQTSSYRCGG
jgi:hypothetical protein